MESLAGALFGKLLDYGFWIAVGLWVQAHVGLVLAIGPMAVLGLLFLAHICPWSKLKDFAIPTPAWIVLGALMVPAMLVGLGDLLDLYCLKGEQCNAAILAPPPRTSTPIVPGSPSVPNQLQSVSG